MAPAASRSARRVDNHFLRCVRTEEREGNIVDFSDALSFLQEDHTSVVTTIGSSGLPQSTIVRAGPYEGKMAFVVRGNTVKLRNIANDPRCTVLAVRPDWTRFATIEGRAEVRGPDDTEAEELRLLLRAIFVAAGGDHDNRDEFDRVMKDERRAAVLVTPERVYGRV
jgi:PPOX class probable F420-dependent enzyme